MQGEAARPTKSQDNGGYSAPAPSRSSFHPARILSRLRLKTRLALLGHNHSLKTGLLYRWYHNKAKKSWGSRIGDLPETDRAAALTFAQQGYVQMPFTVDPAFARAIKEKVDTLFETPGYSEEISPGLFRLYDGLARIPEIIKFLEGPVERTLEAYYQSNFKVFGVYFYRTVPNPDQPVSSFLWHVDNVPTQEVKLMVYLDDTVEETGSFRCKTKPQTDQLKARGWWDRSANERFADVLEESSTTKIFEGQAGTCILFQNGGCVHKATSPIREHRDVVTIKIIPSVTAWRPHFDRNRHTLSTNTGICLNPYTDRPETISYRE